MANFENELSSISSTDADHALGQLIEQANNTHQNLIEEINSFEDTFGAGRRLDFERKFQSIYPAVLNIAKIIDKHTENPDQVFSNFLDCLEDRLEMAPITISDLDKPIYTVCNYRHGFDYLKKELDFLNPDDRAEFTDAANHLTTATENFRAFVFTHATPKDHEFNYSTWLTRIGMPGASEKSSWIFKHALSLMEGAVQGLSRNEGLELDHRQSLSNYFREYVFTDYALQPDQDEQGVLESVNQIDELSNQLTDQLVELRKEAIKSGANEDRLRDEHRKKLIDLFDRLQIDYSLLLDDQEVEQNKDAIAKRSLTLSRGCEAEFVVEGAESFDEIITYLRANGYPTIRTKEEAKRAIDDNNATGTGLYGEHGILFVDQSVNPDRELLEQIRDAIDTGHLAAVDEGYEGSLTNAAIWAHHLTHDGDAEMKTIGVAKTYISVEFASSPGSDIGDEKQAHSIQQVLSSHPKWTVTQNSSMGNHNTVQWPTQIEKNGEQIDVCEDGEVKLDVLKRFMMRATWLTPTISIYTSPEHRHTNLFAAFTPEKGITADKTLKAVRIEMADCKQTAITAYGEDKYRPFAVKGERLVEMRHAQSGNPEVLDKLNRLQLFLMQSAAEGSAIHIDNELIFEIYDLLLEGGEYRKDEMSRYNKIENRDPQPKTMQEFREVLAELTPDYHDHMRPSPADKSDPTELLENVKITVADLISRRLVEENTWKLVKRDRYFDAKYQDGLVCADEADGSEDHIIYYDTICKCPTDVDRGVGPFHRDPKLNRTYAP
jgi:hypothetical protein